MKSLFWLIWPLIYLFPLQAQVDVEIPLGTHAFMEERTFAYLLGEEVPLWEIPDQEGRLLTRMPLGTRLLVVDEGVRIQVQDGIRAHWYKIELEDGKLGWVWGGEIAQAAFRSQSDPGVAFVCGLERLEKDAAGEIETRVYQIRAFIHERQLGKLMLQFPGEGDLHVQNLGKGGIEGVSDIIKVEAHCQPMPNCTTHIAYAFWSQERFSDVLEIMKTGEGYAKTRERLIFPSEMEGMSPYILREQTYLVEEPQFEQDSVLRNRITEYYEWDGRKVVESKREPVRQSYWVKTKP